MIDKRLNIFVDESGDFGFSAGSSELYTISFTIHDSNNSIKKELENLNNSLKKRNCNGVLHLAYLVARREEYINFDLKQRQEIFWTVFNFARRVPVKIRSIIIDKRYMNNSSQLNRSIAIEVNKFISENQKYIDSFDKITIYYDNGQASLAIILDTIFAINNKVDRRINFDHSQKRLFQISDMLTFIDKLDYKYNHKIPLTKAEKYFFSNNEISYIKRKLKNKRI